MTKHRLLQHPTHYVWDFWYLFDARSNLFHVFFLFADPSLVPTDQHHFSAAVGYARTTDFESMEWVAEPVLAADAEGWDDTSIWTGDVVRIDGGALMFYTSRNSATDDGLSQNVGAAVSVGSLESWQRLPIRIAPEPPYEPRSCRGDTSIHAWRDPFVFRHNGETFMLLAAKSRARALGCKGAIALLRMHRRDLARWEVLEPIADPGWYSEMEVPQIYIGSRGEWCLVFSTWAKGDLSPSVRPRGGLHLMRLSDLTAHGGKVAEREVLLDEGSGLYACRVVPELGGEIIGFDIERGGLRRSGVRTGFTHVDRDFSDVRLASLLAKRRKFNALYQ